MKLPVEPPSPPVPLVLPPPVELDELLLELSSSEQDTASSEAVIAPRPRVHQKRDGDCMVEDSILVFEETVDSSATGKMALGGLGAVAIVAAGVFGARALLAQRHADAARSAWADFERCLVGATPFEGPVASRVRALELALSSDERGPTAWPQRCTGRLSEVASELERAGVANADPRSQVARRARALVSASDAVPRYLSGSPAPIEELFSAARAAGYTVEGAKSDTPEPHAPALPLTVGDAPVLAKAGDTRARYSVVRGGPQAVLWAGGAAGDAALCDEGSGDAAAPAITGLRCVSLEGQVGTLAVPVSREPGAASLYWDGLRGPMVLSAPKAEPVAGGFSQTSHVWVDGSVMGEAQSEAGARLLVKREGKLEPVLRQLPNDEAWVGQRGPLIFSETERGEPVVRARYVDVSGLVGAPERVGPAGDRLVALRVCRAGDTFRALVQTNEGIYAAFRDEGGWKATPTVRVDPSLAGAARVDVELTTMGCGADHVALAWMTPDALHELRCAREGCKAQKSGFRPSSATVALGLVEGKLLVAWTAERSLPITGSGYDVRMRLAELGGLEGARDRVLLGDASHDGPPGVGAGLSVLSRGASAAVLVRAEDGVHGLLVDAHADEPAIHGLRP